MGTLTEFVATVVVHSSAAAYSHFGVTLEPVHPDATVNAERVVARSPRQPVRVSDCKPAPVQLPTKNLKA
jgi:hypothetical protein